MNHNFRNFCCSRCHLSHPYEKIGDYWISKGYNCNNHYKITKVETPFHVFSTERKLNELDQRGSD